MHSCKRASKMAPGDPTSLCNPLSLNVGLDLVNTMWQRMSLLRSGYQKSILSVLGILTLREVRCHAISFPVSLWPRAHRGLEPCQQPWVWALKWITPRLRLEPQLTSRLQPHLPNQQSREVWFCINPRPQLQHQGIWHTPYTWKHPLLMPSPVWRRHSLPSTSENLVGCFDFQEPFLFYIWKILKSFWNLVYIYCRMLV